MVYAYSEDYVTEVLRKKKCYKKDIHEERSRWLYRLVSLTIMSVDNAGCTESHVMSIMGIKYLYF